MIRKRIYRRIPSKKSQLTMDSDALVRSIATAGARWRVRAGGTVWLDGLAVVPVEMRAAFLEYPEPVRLAHSVREYLKCAV